MWVAFAGNIGPFGGKFKALLEDILASFGWNMALFFREYRAFVLKMWDSIAGDTGLFFMRSGLFWGEIPGSLAWNVGQILGFFVWDPKLFRRETSESLKGDAGLLCGEYEAILREIRGSFANDIELFRKRLGLVLLGLLFYIHIYIYIRIHIYTYIYIYIRIHIHTYMYVYMLGLLFSFAGNIMVLCVYLHTFMYICTSICISIHVYICKYICIFEYICIWIQVHI